MKKIPLFFFLIVIVGLSIWFFFIQETYRNPFGKAHPFEAIPNSSPIILTFNDFFQLRHHLTKMPYAKDLNDVFFVKKMSEDFNALRKLFSKNKNHQQLLLDSKITASLHLSGKNDVDFLYIIDDQDKVFSLDELLESFSHKESQLNGNIVYTLSLDQKNKFTVASFNNLLLVSRYAYLVETGMQQLKNPFTNLLNNERLEISKKAKQQADQIEAHVLFDNFKAFATPFLNPKPIEQLNYFSKICESGHWTFVFQETGVAINGSLKPFRDSDFFNQYFSNNKITNTQVQDILPQNIAYFVRQSLNGKEEIKEKNTRNVFNEYFKPWIAEEWLQGRTQIFTRKMRSEKFVAYEMTDLKMAQYHLEKLSDSVGLIKNWEYQTYPIRQILLEELPIPFFEGEEIEMQNPCYAFIENYVVFSKSTRIIENWIDQYLVNQTLARNITFLKMKNLSTNSEAVEFYWNQKTAQKFFENALAERNTTSKDQIFYWKNFSIGLNGRWENNQLLHDGFLFYEKETEEIAEIRWRTPLQAQAHTQPFAIYNDEKGSHDILIQDKENRLYLFNNEGEEEWNILLDAPILSKIVGGNFIQDESPLIMFNTKDEIHQIDFDGKNQNSFPLKLSSSAVNGMLLADFSEGEYGVFLACENEILYGFDMKGIPFSGWQGLEKIGKVSTPLKHFQIGNKDYIVAFNDKGDFFSYGKNGFKRREGFGITSSSTQPLCLQIQNNNNEILIADPSGYQRAIDLEGERLSLLQKNTLPEADQKYASADLAGNNQTDFVVLENNELQIFYNHQNEFVQYGKFRFLNAPDEIFPVRSQNMGKAMIGAVNEKQEQIFLIDKKGSLHQDFPLAGTTSFELVNLFSENRKVVLVANKDQVLTYQLP